MIGKEILGYQLQEEIGRGTFATVYKVSKINVLGTYARAMKVISLPTEKQYTDVLHSMGGDYSKTNDYFLSILEEVANEITIMDSLADRGVEQIVKYFEHDVVERGEESKFYDIYILMEYLTPFKDYLDDHQLVVADVIRLGKDILRALSRCHELNMIHRDVKDSNIFVSENGTFKLGDFGVSKILGDATSAATLKGTPTYIAPEVYLAGQKYDETVDLYSLGIVLYRLLNYFRQPFLPAFPQPYSGRDEFLALEKRLSGQVPNPPSQAPQALGEVILKAINPRSTRFDSAQEFLVALESVEAHLSPEELGLELGSVLANKPLPTSPLPAKSVEEEVVEEKQALLDETISLEYDATLAVHLYSGKGSDIAPVRQPSLPQLFETIPPDNRGGTREGQVTSSVSESVIPVFPLQGKVTADQATLAAETSHSVAPPASQPSSPPKVDQPVQSKTPSDQVTDQAKTDATKVKSVSLEKTLPEKQTVPTTQLPASSPVKPAGSQPGPSLGSQIASAQLRERLDGKNYLALGLYASLFLTFFIPSSTTWSATSLFLIGFVCLAVLIYTLRRAKQLTPGASWRLRVLMTILSISLLFGVWSKFEYRYANGDRYRGQLLEGLPHGQGQLVTTSGITFEGEFAKGALKSATKAIYSNGAVYEGEVQDNKANGKGKLTYSNGDVYEGDFVNGIPQGKGKLTYSNGDIYEGEFAHGSYNGKGKLTLKNGRIYEGTFANGKVNGQAKDTQPSGIVYEGQYKDGFWHGQGRLTLADGSYEEGHFENGHFSGTGRVKETLDWGVYEGEVRELSWHGKGKLTRPNGSVYEGDFVDGVQHGRGRTTFKSGGVYEGDYVKGYEHGRGRYIYEDGTVLEGNFVYDPATRQVNVTDTTGRVHEKIIYYE